MKTALVSVVILVIVAGAMSSNPPEKKKCKPDDYHCGDGKCIPKTFVCDGAFDCGNGNDEADCKGSNLGSRSADPMADFPPGDDLEAPTFPLEFGGRT
ncbi:subgroup A Rous sarcoma virus receptor pg950-like isoform X2 [Macrobrachium nipponense]|uniref:subgroup A Rous sarcoma virus receptor pg950-like isoform X2 n=1 Tax=Macrobrachium nipponense TaxID=159736 RepID=UPI0030C86DBE